MGKSIIFVGRTNLNKNFDNQSMYKSDYGHYLKLDRDQFYRDLCEACRTCPGKKKRNNKISRLRSKYQGYSCSERTMEKVFTAYLECFGRPMGQPEYRKKVYQLPLFLEKEGVDKRIVRRIIDIEGITSSVKNDLNNKKEDNEDLLRVKRERLHRFHELLNIYLVECVYNEDVSMDSELEDLFKIYERSPEYINKLKNIYRRMVKSDISLSKANKKSKNSLTRTDKNGLDNAYAVYKKKQEA
ncbi:hypothetical protein PSH12_13725 [Enterococcus casseliflavus]|uniref:hypothetical protein n=1 Tax=Enterococcus casseliflavus TaxID=37734 RepID=UPI002952A59E|nr:hypothetical protein [Enterococcus casseliflavus]MDV7713656.1 hypothetical protein [Enterococcus casseliflavus]